VLNNYTLKLLQSTNFEIDIFKQNLSKQIEVKRIEEENKVIEIRKSKTNLLKLEQLLVENLTNDYPQLIIENINKINKLNYDALNSQDILTSNLSIQNFIYELENGTLLQNLESNNSIESDQSSSKSYKGGSNLFSEFLNSFNLSLSSNMLELTCEDVVNQVKNQKLQTMFGGEIEMIYFDKVSLVNQTKDEILCKSYITTSNAVDAWYNIRLFKKDENVFYEVKARLDSENQDITKINNSKESSESSSSRRTEKKESQNTLVLGNDVSTIPTENTEDISQIETFYVDSCNQDLEILEDSIEISTAMCKCIFNSIMNAGLTKEELFGTNGMYEVYQARAKGTNEGFTDIESKIVDIQMDSVGNCMLETNYFNYLYDLPIKE
jgi:hypothetical protein